MADELFARASAVIPGGVNSPVRAFGSVGGTPYFVESALGAFVTDTDGRSYLDYVQSWGASILGHADPGVLSAICRAAERGTTFGAPTEAEVLLAEALVAAVPGLEQARLVSSGTEATMTAIRLARGATGREKILKFAGCYHGHSDGLLAAGGSGVATLGLAGSAGVPAGAVADTIVAPYNVVPAIDGEIACVIVEPVAANMGLVPPAPGFLQGLRRVCDEAGSLLIFDEVITGFRLRRGSVADLVSVQPDLWTFGKVIGGGLPLAALGGRRDLMAQLAPLGPVYQAGTLSGNPLATAAGLSVLARLDAASFDELAARVSRLATGLEEAISSAGLVVQVPVFRTLFAIFFSHEPVSDYDGAKAAAANGLYAKFFHAMLARGVALAPSAYEVGFCSLAHSDADVRRTVEAAAEAAAEVAAGA
ncbi:MAG TPA: glutamate-1-semialdehyde 2,1-aminomutase [Acidimicrobiales bacterium]|jgi:glutamate-1-semialdehyde 2,1-aminomutase|nr:glutamate-1-semialdehyde 2,1-aminomutase [Acidimicrobiales bacterium]